MGKRLSVRDRRVWALALVVILVGVVVTPAQGHVTGSVSHVIKHAKKFFYTKAQSEARFIDVGEKAADADLLDGQEASAFLGANAKAADSNLFDGTDSAAFAKKLGNVVTVSASGGDFDTIQEAIDAVESDPGAPYLVLVGPGHYNERVTLDPGMVLQGAGSSLTRLVVGGAESCVEGFGVKAAAASEVRDLTIFNFGGACSVGVLNEGFASRYSDVAISIENASVKSVGVLNTGGGSVTLERVSVSAASTADAGAVAVGIDQTGGSTVILRDSQVSPTGNGAAGYGIRNDASSAFVRDSEVFAHGAPAPTEVAILNQNSAGNSVSVVRSRITSLPHAISSGAGFSVSVRFSELDGAVTGGTATCLAVIDGSTQTFSAGSCPS